MVDMAHYAGLVAAGLHDDPVPLADYVTSTTHKTLRGPRGGMILCKEAYAKDVDRAVFPGMQGGPLMHVVAGKAVCFGEVLAPAFKQYAQQILDNAKALADVLLSGGLTLVSGGTDNHLILADVTSLGTTGGEAEAALDRCGITVNKNMIPFDERKPMDPSGIRIGTPALTTRGMGCDEMRHIGGWILEVLAPPTTRSWAATSAAEWPICAASSPSRRIGSARGEGRKVRDGRRPMVTTVRRWGIAKAFP